MEGEEFILIIILAVVALFLCKALINWYYEIPKRNRLLEEILAELKTLNASFELDDEKEKQED